MAKPISIHYTITGPFFSQVVNSGKAFDQANREWVTDLIREGEAKALAQLYSGHGEDTGEYKRSVQGRVLNSQHGVVQQAGDRRNAIVGNWLEGKRSRHERHRFRGYHIWRKTRTHVRRLANELAGRVYSRATKRLT
jgi:hypothetical protein